MDSKRLTLLRLTLRQPHYPENLGPMGGGDRFLLLQLPVGTDGCLELSPSKVQKGLKSSRWEGLWRASGGDFSACVWEGLWLGGRASGGDFGACVYYVYL